MSFVLVKLMFVPAVRAAIEANLHRCLQQHGQRSCPEGTHSSGCGVLQCCFADQPKPGDTPLLLSLQDSHSHAWLNPILQHHL